MKWVETYKINANDADVNDTVSASGVLRYMQDTANCQMEGEGPSYRELLDRGQAFVVSRLRLSLYDPLRAHDVIESETWTTPSKGAIFNRCFRIKRDGMIMAEAATCWALVGIKNRKIYRVSEVDFSYGEDEPLELDAPARIHARSPSPPSRHSWRTPVPESMSVAVRNIRTGFRRKLSVSNLSSFFGSVS